MLVCTRWAEIQQCPLAWIACLPDLGPLEGLAIVTEAQNTSKQKTEANNNQIKFVLNLVHLYFGHYLFIEG